MTQKSKISAIAVVISLGFCASVVFHYYQGSVLRKSYPNNTFLFSPVDRFADFYILPSINFDLNPYFRDTPSAQYPLVNVFGYLFSLLPQKYSFLFFALITSTAFIFLAYMILWGRENPLPSKFILVLSIVILSYPFLFTIDRGNIEILLFVFLLLFLFFFLKNNIGLSAFFLSFAIAMKVYPVVLLLLYVPQKKYREISLSIGLAALLTFGSLALFTGGLFANIQFLVYGSNLSSGNLILFTGTKNMVQRGVSLFTLFKIFLIESGRISHINMPKFLSLYIKVAVLSFAPVAAYVVFIEKIFWRQVALLIFAMLLLPQISADYKLIHIYLPLFLFILSEEHSGLDFIYLMFFGLLMIPKDYAYFPNTLSDTGTHDISISVAINIVLMVLMSFLIIASGIKDFILKNLKLTANI